MRPRPLAAGSYCCPYRLRRARTRYSCQTSRKPRRQGLTGPDLVPVIAGFPHLFDDSVSVPWLHKLQSTLAPPTAKMSTKRYGPAQGIGCSILRQWSVPKVVRTWQSVETLEANYSEETLYGQDPRELEKSGEVYGSYSQSVALLIPYIAEVACAPKPHS